MKGLEAEFADMCGGGGSLVDAADVVHIGGSQFEGCTTHAHMAWR